MKYTFDDAVKELEQDVFWTTGFPELPEIEFEKVKAVLNKLREKYAPTVEMTREQYETLTYYKRNEDNYANPLAQLLLSLYEDVSGGDDWGLYDGWDVDEDSDLILYVEAWKKPETIKVIDE